MATDNGTDHVLSLQIVGKDRPGLLAEVAGLVSALRGNIVHMEQRQVRGFLTLLMLIEDPDPEGRHSKERLVSMGHVLKTRLQPLGLDAAIQVARSEPDPPVRDLQVITLLGADKIGVMHAIARTIADHGVPIIQTHHVASGELMAFEIIVDVGSDDHDLQQLRQDLRETCEAIGVDVVVQPHGVHRRRRRLVVFDMDSTLIEGEVIDELAKVAGVEDEVAELTRRAMQGKMDFADALRERVKRLEGLPVSELEAVAGAMTLTPGASDLVRVLKQMGFKVGLISGGFTFFTDRLKEQLGLDYAFANRLVVADGKLTGEVEGEIIDAARKGELVKEIAASEGIDPADVVAIGDGANDQIMLKNAGLGIAFNAKQVLRQAADGQITKSNLVGLLYSLGATDLELKKYRQRRDE